MFSFCTRYRKMVDNRLLRFHLMTQCDCILFDFGVRLRSSFEQEIERYNGDCFMVFFLFFKQLKSVESTENGKKKKVKMESKKCVIFRNNRIKKKKHTHRICCYIFCRSFCDVMKENILPRISSKMSLLCGFP